MRKRQFYVLVLAVVLGLTVSVGLAQAQEKCSPKVDNFVFFVDQSGSMYMTWEGKDVYRGHAFIKERMAKQLLAQIARVSDSQLRMYGLSAMIAGILLLFIMRG